MARSSITRTGITDSAAQPKRKWPAMIKDRAKADDEGSSNGNNNATTDTTADSSEAAVESKGHKHEVSDAADAVAAVTLNSSSSSVAGDKVPQDASYETSSPSKEVSSALEESNQSIDDNPWLTNKAPGLLAKGNSLAMKGHHLPPLAAVAKSLSILVSSKFHYSASHMIHVNTPHVYS